LLSLLFEKIAVRNSQLVVLLSPLPRAACYRQTCILKIVDYSRPF
jgi:hypothetical protein